MHKDDYLKKTEVNSFIDWFRGHISAESTLRHFYMMAGKGRQSDGNSISFNNPSDALKNYDWNFSFKEPGKNITHKGKTYEENSKGLTLLKKNLENAISKDDDENVKDCAIAVFKWGGVTAHNKQWAEENVIGLAKKLKNVANVLCLNNDVHPLFEEGDFRFNAGMTKIYSLLLEKFIIYDSRVAAALAWLVVMSLDGGKGGIEVPPLLNFPCMPPKEAKTAKIHKVRNPSGGIYQFQNMGNKPSLHAQWNLRASWIIEAVVKGPGETAFHKSADPVRSLEAAMFMWGYDLSKNSPWRDGVANIASAG